MITVEEASKTIRECLPRLGNTPTSAGAPSLQKSVEPLVSDREYPPFHRVMMDGIAVSYEAFANGQKTFRMSGVCAAGSAAGRLDDFASCLEVMTGAPLPLGADLVIPYEDLEIRDGAATISVDEGQDRMEYVHLKGSDCRSGATLLEAGEPLNGPHWGIAASVGYSQIVTSRKPRVNVVSTGDELVDLDIVPESHQIRRSNAYAIEASLRLHGIDEVTLSHLPDDEESIRAHYSTHSQKHDWMIYSGGVSKGKFDHLPKTWKSMGVTEHFHGIRQRPGKPFWFGVDPSRNTAVFGLPGNPVSTLVCLHRYLLSEREIYARLDADIEFEAALTYFAPARVRFEKDGTLVATPLLAKNSGEFSALAGSTGFLELPSGQNLFRRGESFRFYSWSPWM